MIWEQEGYVDPTVEELSGREDTIVTVVTLPLVKKEQNDHHQDHHQGGNAGGETGVDLSEARYDVLGKVGSILDISIYPQCLPGGVPLIYRMGSLPQGMKKAQDSNFLRFHLFRLIYDSILFWSLLKSSRLGE